MNEMKKLYARSFQKILHLSMYFLPFRKPKLYEGQNSVDHVIEILNRLKQNKVLIVTDKTMLKLGLEKRLLKILEDNRIEYEIYDRTSVDPTIENVLEAYEIYVKHNFKVVIALGGGSVIDCSKALCAKAVKPRKSLYKMKGLLKIRKRIAPLIAIPTTAGTGSEATAAAVIRNQDNREKYAISDVSVIPRYAILDPQLIESLPKDYTAYTGMDALTHAIEAYIGKSRTRKTKKYALEAIRLINDNIETSYQDPYDLEARENMLKGAFLAGLAFTRSFVGYVHAIAHTLGGLYHIPHGLANSVILPYVLKTYDRSIHKKMAKIARNIGIEGKTPEQSFNNVVEWIEQLQGKLAIPKQLDIAGEDFELIIQRVQKETIPVYPVPKILTDFQVRKLLVSIRNTNDLDYLKAVDNNFKFFEKNRHPDIKARKIMLKRLLKSITDHEAEIYTALEKDLGKHEFEAFTSEVSFAKSEIRLLLKKIKRWANPKRVKTPLVSIGGKSKVLKQPKGVVLVFSPWNYPFQLTMLPMISALGAGNNVILKPSPFSLHTTAIMKQIIQECFTENRVYLVETDAKNDIEIATQLLKLPFNHIFFTGSTKVGKIVYQAATDKLIPVTLELGGKNPVIIDNTANLKYTAKRIVWGKSINSGQTCIAPDYMLVDKAVKAELVQEMQKAIKTFFDNDMIASNSYSSIINQSHFARLTNLLKEQKIIFGGKSDEKKRKMELTLLDSPRLGSKVMQEEIFGPILPIFEYENVDEACEIIKKYSNPLALYIFSKDKNLIRKLNNEISFGGGAINDVLMHFVSNKLPFGGIGNSGMGNYHGKYGFDTFTHEKSILKQTFLFDVPLRYAPFKKIILRFIKVILR